MSPARSALRTLPDAVRPHLPPDLAGFHSGARFSLVQLWYGNRAIHYEATARPRLGTVEIGLHFEADALANARLLGAFRGHEKAIRRRLGAVTRIEEWDRGWARVWEPVAATEVDEALVARLGERLARYVTALEPILRRELPADLAWIEPRTARR